MLNPRQRPDHDRGIRVTGAGKAAVPIGVAASALRLRQAYAADGGDLGDHTGHAAAQIAGGWAGAAAGAEGGALFGAAVESVIPGPVTAVDGFIGGAAGGIAASEIADRGYQWGKTEWTHWFGTARPTTAATGSTAASPAHATNGASDEHALWRDPAGLTHPSSQPPPPPRPSPGARLTS